ncbi:hypothetical protein PATSB16_20790 [Pandoraea thiooxydans]|uniref:Uncharacterized protein n=1 Tax=Pandoraea thiooxydans TaxID=445709 RepID=A0A0G3EMD9_9BURK|nr:hypothetical protein [Pandoraea thiooxydans]AKJ68140.1 hypothetical protein ABW99_07875 [Pandoraea thiooxydans]APR95419.1 hypothetical protein PATSB16_20790 [Pandoraea thiooxydans]
MSLSPISAQAGSSGFSPYDVGAADLQKAQNDLKQLSALKVTANDYKDANATHGWWGIFNGFSDKSAKQALINRQTALEDDASKHLFSVAAANERGQLSPAMLKQAQGLAAKLSDRLWQDDTNASATNTPGGDGVAPHFSQYSQTADERARPQEDHDLKEALAGGNQPDVISLSQTPKVIKQALALDAAIRSDINTYEHGSSAAARSAAHARLAGADYTEMFDLSDRVSAQTGFLRATPGVSKPKIASLPDGDPQKAAYVRQYSDLINLVLNNGPLERDHQMLPDALSGIPYTPE